MRDELLAQAHTVAPVRPIDVGVELAQRVAQDCRVLVPVRNQELEGVGPVETLLGSTIARICRPTNLMLGIAR